MHELIAETILEAFALLLVYVIRTPPRHGTLKLLLTTPPIAGDGVSVIY